MNVPKYFHFIFPIEVCIFFRTINEAVFSGYTGNRSALRTKLFIVFADKFIFIFLLHFSVMSGFMKTVLKNCRALSGRFFSRQKPKATI